MEHVGDIITEISPDINYDFQKMRTARDKHAYDDAQKEAFDTGWIAAISSLMLPECDPDASRNNEIHGD